eukprot:scaffold10325_cov123-Isochrysis_galbana.AAC.6
MARPRLCVAAREIKIPHVRSTKMAPTTPAHSRLHTGLSAPPLPTQAACGGSCPADAPAAGVYFPTRTTGVRAAPRQQAVRSASRQLPCERGTPHGGWPASHPTLSRHTQPNPSDHNQLARPPDRRRRALPPTHTSSQTPNGRVLCIAARGVASERGSGGTTLLPCHRAPQRV